MVFTFRKNTQTLRGKIVLTIRTDMIISQCIHVCFISQTFHLNAFKEIYQLLSLHDCVHTCLDIGHKIVITTSSNLLGCEQIFLGMVSGLEFVTVTVLRWTPVMREREHS